MKIPVKVFLAGVIIGCTLLFCACGKRRMSAEHREAGAPKDTHMTEEGHT